MTELASPKQELVSPESIVTDLEGLFGAFDFTATSAEAIVEFAEAALDFRQGRPREDTPWEEGVELTDQQKLETIAIAKKWNMLDTTFPRQPFDHVVVLGAHKSTLQLRLDHAMDIYEQNKQSEPGIVLLSCYRPMHPKEGVDFTRIDTESDLAVVLLEERLQEPYKKVTVSCWEDLKTNDEHSPEYAIASMGRVGLAETVVISGSIPSGSVRATTVSTLQSLRSYFELSRARLLFVTTSLHVPYQGLQIERIMQGINTEVVGVGYPSLESLCMGSPDFDFRKVLQEIGATIKNLFLNTNDTIAQVASSI